jgi:hypothetical protein
MQFWLFYGLTAVTVTARLADRSRVVKQRQLEGKIATYHDNGMPLEGPHYRANRRNPEDVQERLAKDERAMNKLLKQKEAATKKTPSWMLPLGPQNQPEQDESPDQFGRKLSTQLSGCCSNYQNYQANTLCSLYGNDCESEWENSHDSGDQDCEQDGLSFIGISFSVNTASGNPYSYQLCDQFPMENIIDRDYEYIMSMDEDGWLVGGGYKTFDYSGKMPYVGLCNSKNSDIPAKSLTFIFFSAATLILPTRRLCVLVTWTPIREVPLLIKSMLRLPRFLFRPFPFSRST